MAVPWGQALQVGGVGFSMVFLVLITLAIVIWLTGLVITRINSGKGKTDDKKKGA
jgi:Na+-transporting methylmalonyl-CoA/oxaloacetate decarboxylase gamma subunit